MRIPNVRSLVPNGRPSLLILAAAGAASLAGGVGVGLVAFDGGSAEPTAAPVNPGPATTISSEVTDRPSVTATRTAAGKVAGTTPTDRPRKSRTATATPTATKKKTRTATTTTTTPPKAAASKFLIHNASSGLCVDLPGYGAVTQATVTQFTCRAGNIDNQQYQKVNASDGAFMLRNVMSQLCLDVTGYGAVDPGTEMLIYTCDGDPDGDNLMFRARANGDGAQLVNLKSDLCLDISADEGSTDDLDRALELNTCDSSSSTQVWSFS